MRRLSLCILLASACFSPDDGSADGTGSTGGTTSGSVTNASVTTTAASTVDSTMETTASTEQTAGSSETTASVDESTSTATTADDDSSSSDTGPPAGCADFDGRVIFVNLGGAELTMGLVDNAPASITQSEQLVGIWPGYTTDDADEVYALVEGHFAAFHVCLTRETPPVPDYSMIVVSSQTFQDPNFLGFGIVDCSDSELNSVNVVVLSEEAGIAPTSKAIALSKHIGHMFGLESVIDAPDDLMNQFVGNTLNGATFTDTCYVSTATATCNSAVTCAVDQQQSGPYLEALFGPA